jgi:uncharacterized protein
MAINPKLLDILACPACKTGVKPELRSNALRCPSCERVFPIRDDVPIMLVESGDVPSN